MIERTSLGVIYFQFHSLVDQPGLVHAISSRDGGVSAAPYDTLNLSLSVGDDPSQVQVNRQRFAQALGVAVEEITGARQVHGAEVWRVGREPVPPKGADILVTDQPDRFLSQRFGDCVPLLLWDPVGRVAALAHAGWRGTARGVAGAAVRALAEGYGSAPSALLACIGPSIGPCCYKVGPEVAVEFRDQQGCWLPTDDGRMLLDLWELNRLDLVAAGVKAERVELARLCTRCHRRTFFSHRAAGGPAGRFGSLIGMMW